MRAASIHVLALERGAIRSTDAFLDPTLFAALDLPAVKGYRCG